MYTNFHIKMKYFYLSSRGKVLVNFLKVKKIPTFSHSNISIKILRNF